MYSLFRVQLRFKLLESEPLLTSIQPFHATEKRSSLQKQEYIPVGCMPSASVLNSGGRVSTQRGTVSTPGGFPEKRCLSRVWHLQRQIPRPRGRHPPSEQNDTQV